MIERLSSDNSATRSSFCRETIQLIRTVCEIMEVTMARMRTSRSSVAESTNGLSMLSTPMVLFSLVIGRQMKLHGMSRDFSVPVRSR